MNWFNVLKNQFSTTADAQFELDFDNPMVEEEEDKCRKRLLKLFKKLNEYILSNQTKFTKAEVYFEPENLNGVSEEDCCRILEYMRVHAFSAGEDNVEFETAFVEQNFYFNKKGAIYYFAVGNKDHGTYAPFWSRIITDMKDKNIRDEFYALMQKLDEIVKEA